MDTADLYLIYTFITARKQSLRRLCFHVCLSFHGGRAWRGRGQGGMRRRGHAWVVGGVHAKGGGAWQERRQLQQVVRILLECILVLFNVTTFHTF